MIDRPGFAQFRERVGAAVDLDRLRRSDIKGYVEHRLSVAGWTGDPQITDAAFDLIFETTGGLPRRINKFLARSLLAAFLDERHEIDTPLVAQVKAELREDPSWKEDILPATALDDGPSAPPLNKGLESRISELESEVKSIEKMLRQLLDLLVKRQHGN